MRNFLFWLFIIWLIVRLRKRKAQKKAGAARRAARPAAEAARPAGAAQPARAEASAPSVRAAGPAVRAAEPAVSSPLAPERAKAPAAPKPAEKSAAPNADASEPVEKPAEKPHIHAAEGAHATQGESVEEHARHLERMREADEALRQSLDALGARRRAQRQQLRAAVVMSEILGRPAALRPRGSIRR